MIRQRVVSAFFLGMAVAIIPFSVFHNEFVEANSEIEKLQSEISSRNARLQQIEAEIAAYKIELQKVGAEKNTLQKAINQLELERKKVEADIAYTQNRIGATDLEISKLNIEISATEESIEKSEQAIMEIIRLLSESEANPFVISLLQYDNLAELWDAIEELSQVRSVMSEEVRSLVSQKLLLEKKRGDSTEKREDLVDLKAQYADQSIILSSNKATKAELLEETKNEEESYQQILAERQAAQAQLLKELRDFESKLQFILDPNTIPPVGTPVFSWPLENVIITQLFGGTEFAKQNASVYAGRAYHPGIDMGTPVGTKIFAPLGGTVRATGNTDAVPGCYSWGKWTLIDHPNGLATLYAHQSQISVVAGQVVSTGDVIGYSGNTGYSTGPHLHFTVYAKAGVSVRQFNEIKAVTSCGAATTPVAATDAYIDPMNYLPAR